MDFYFLSLRHILKSSRILSFLKLAALLSIACSVSAQDSPALEPAPPIQISAALPTNGNVAEFAISPNNQYAVYIADQNNDEVFELFSVRMDGSAEPTLLSIPNPVAGGDVGEIVGFSADGERVTYIADQETDTVNDLINVRIDGSARTNLTSDFSSSVNSLVVDTELTPDRTRVIFAAAPNTPNIVQLFSVPVDGGPVVRLSNNSLPNGAVLSLIRNPRISSDSNKVIYAVSNFINSQDVLTELHITNSDGSGTTLRLDNSEQSIVTDSLEISNDGNRIVYRVEDATGQEDLYSVAATGGPAVRLNLPASGSVSSFRINTFNSNFVYYLVWETIDRTRTAIFGVSITGDDIPWRISPVIEPGLRSFVRFTSMSTGNSTLGNGSVSKNLNRFSSNQNGSIISYYVSTLGVFGGTLRGIVQSNNNEVLISGQLQGLGAAVFDPSISQSGEYVTVLSRRTDITFPQELEDGVVGLRLGENADRVLLNNEESGFVNSLATNSGQANRRVISKNDKIVAYTNSNRVGNDGVRRNLFVSSLESGGAVRLNPELPEDSSISNVLISDDGAFVVYTADQEVAGQVNLYASAITEPEPDELCFPITATNGEIVMICL